MKKLLQIINQILSEKNVNTIDSISKETLLRQDLGFSSLDLASLTVMIEDVYGIDVFENEMISTVGQIIDKLEINE